MGNSLIGDTWILVSMKKILIIERQIADRELLTEWLRKKSIQTVSVEGGGTALELLQNSSFDVIFSDLKGIEMLKRTKKRPPKTPLVFLKKKGEHQRKDVEITIEKPLEISRLENSFSEIRTQKSRCEIIAESPLMQKILRRVEKIAISHSNIFICGQSGTGKEVIASMIHAGSKRSSFPFIRVNCAALSDTLIESEFFGHEKGAFTGAHTQRIGRFELSNQGTLLLDEVSEIPASLQAKLLRVVQEQEFERVGATSPIPIDVRLISTSNRDMKSAIQNKEFREDLYYRLNVIPIYLPSLEKRREDIIPLAYHFLKEVCQKNHLSLKTFSSKAKKVLVNCKWPGNIRQLRNVIEYAAITSDVDEIGERQLFFDEIELCEEKKSCFASDLCLKEVEKLHILSTLKAYQGNRTHAAKQLGISVRTLRSKLKMYAAHK